MSATVENIADGIKRFRTEHSLTQRELAERMASPDEDLNSLVRNIQRWESGKLPRSNQLSRIADTIGVSLDDLLSNGAAA